MLGPAEEDGTLVDQPSPNPHGVSLKPSTFRKSSLNDSMLLKPGLLAASMLRSPARITEDACETGREDSSQTEIENSDDESDETSSKFSEIQDAKIPSYSRSSRHSSVQMPLS